MASFDAFSAATTAVLAAGGGSVLSQLVSAWLRRGKDRSEQDSVIVESAKEVVTMLRGELQEQEQRHRTEMSRLRGQLADARAEIDQLRGQLAAAGTALGAASVDPAKE